MFFKITINIITKLLIIAFTMANQGQVNLKIAPAWLLKTGLFSRNLGLFYHTFGQVL